MPLLYFMLCSFTGFVIMNLIFSYQAKYVDPGFWSTTKFQLYVVPIFTVVNILVGYGFKSGFQYFNNMTYVVAVSKVLDVTALLIAAYFIFSEVPTYKTILGFIILGIMLVKPN